MTEGVGRGTFSQSVVSSTKVAKREESNVRDLFGSLFAAQLIPQDATPVLMQSGDMSRDRSNSEWLTSDEDAHLPTSERIQLQNETRMQSERTVTYNRGTSDYSKTGAPSARSGEDSAWSQNATSGMRDKTENLAASSGGNQGGASKAGGSADSAPASGENSSPADTASVGKDGAILTGEVAAGSDLAEAADRAAVLSDAAALSDQQASDKKGATLSVEGAALEGEMSMVSESSATGGDAGGFNFDQNSGFSAQVAQALSDSMPVGTRRVMQRGDMVSMEIAGESGMAQGSVTTSGVTPAAQPVFVASNSVIRFEDLMEKFDKQMLSMTERNDKSMVLTVEPAAFGRLTVTCREEGSRLMVEIQAENSAVRDALLRQEGSVRQILQENGIKMGQFDVSSDGGSSSSYQSQDEQALSERMGFGISPATNIQDGAGAEKTIRAHTGWSLIA